MRLCLRAAVLLLIALCPLAFLHAADLAWTTPLPPFRIIGNLYYIGSQDLAAYLVVTPAGNILINSNLESSPPQLEASVERLGFHFADTRILLISHGHYDHAGGSAKIKQQTGARYMVMDGDVSVVEDGGRSDFALGREARYRFPPAKVDRILHDGDTVQLGGTTLVAHRTAGHTRGCTTWTMQLTQAGRTYHVVIIGSTSVLDNYRLTRRESYPGIAADYEQTFQTLKALPCDFFLGSHGSFFGLKEKLASKQPDPFLDPAGYRSYIDDSEHAFHAALAKQQKALR